MARGWWLAWLVLAHAVVDRAAPGAEPAVVLVEPAAGTADAEVAQRIDELLAARLKQLQAFWPPRVRPERPIRVELYGTLDEYRSAVARRGAPIDNPAAYFAGDATIVLGFDGGRFGSPLQRQRERAAKLRDDMQTAKLALIDQLQNDEARFKANGTPRYERNRLTNDRRRAFQVTVAAMQKAIDAAERQNRATLEEATARLSAAAAHELFHAYVDACVYPPAKGALPVWLNEGLAQVVERTAATAKLNKSTRADAELAAEWHELRKRGAAIRLGELLSTDATGYLTHAGNPSHESRKYYLAAWAAAQGLLNDGKLQPGEALDRFVQDRDADAARRFERLCGATVAEWEKSHWK